MSGKNVTDVVLADAQGIAQAARIIEQGGLVAVPTETVYGLAARADSAEAVARIYEAKGRPSFNPLIVHVRDKDHAEQYGRFPEEPCSWPGWNWPGPLTLVLPRKSDVGLAKTVCAGLPTIALRVPDHPVMQELLKATMLPLAAPSANRSGRVSPTTAQHVLDSLDGRIDLVLDAGPTQRGVESTIIKLFEDGSWEELRPGPVETGFGPEDSDDPFGPILSEVSSIEAPGQLKSHYSPGKPVRLNASAAEWDEFMIGFGEIKGDCTLSDLGYVKQAASRLYDCLHDAALSDKPKIAVAPIPYDLEGRAINDRLRRAATPPD